MSLLGSPIPSAYIRKEERLKINDLAFYLKNLEKIKHKEWKRKEKVKKKKKVGFNELESDQNIEKNK